MTDWQPIETCPEDQYVFVWIKSRDNLDYGERIEACKTENHSTGWVGLDKINKAYFDKGILYFSHWMPLPKPPTTNNN